MFGWLLGKKKDHKKGGKPPSSSGKSSPRQLDAGDSVLPDLGHEFGHTKTALEEASDRAMQQRREQRKVDRMGRREALFGIVREIMLRSGILSSAYKFKVLSIDQKGRHFLVLLDLSLDLAHSEPAERLLEIEKMIAETSMSRMQVVVQAVYWRYFSPSQAATVRLSSGDTQPGGLSAHIGIGNDTAAAHSSAGSERKSENSAADAISTALAELRAKNRAKLQERATAEQHIATTPPPVAQAQGNAAAASSTTFAATQIITASHLAAANLGQTEVFAETQMQSRLAHADEDELAAFQRALQTRAPVHAQEDAQASIFVSGQALNSPSESDHIGLDEHFADDGADLSGTQYGELPKF
jgi:hypothetical protein